MLNDERYAGPTILVAGPNFGTGSSREHAVWAIMDYGFEAVVSPRFGDIFRNNSHQERPRARAWSTPRSARALMRAVEADPTLEITVDVEPARCSRRRRSASTSAFPLDDATRERFLEGLDDIGITLRNDAAIAAYEASRPAWLPTATPT